MPIPRVVGKLNRVGLNHLMRPFTRHAPGFAVVHHTGRRSGRPYETPVNLFPVEGGFVIALTYGSRTDWVRNVIAAGGCVVETRGRQVACRSPHVYRDETRRRIRPVERAVLGVLGVTEFMELTAER